MVKAFGKSFFFIANSFNFDCKTTFSMDFADIGVKAAIIWINTDGYSMMDGHLAIKKSMIFHSHWKHHL